MRHCEKCGSANIKKTNIKYSKHPWKNYSEVELLFDQEALTCLQCGNLILSYKDIVALEKNIQQSIQLKTDEAIKFLTHEVGLTQEQLSTALGITPEYLSILKSGKKVLSFTTFNLLQSYMKHPELITELTGVKTKPAPTQSYQNGWISTGHVSCKAIRIRSTPELEAILLTKSLHGVKVESKEEDQLEEKFPITHFDNLYTGYHGRPKTQ